MNETDLDLKNMAECYKERYQGYGYSPSSLMWNKGKQDIRFNVLTSQYDFTGKSILDVGCGFGDLNRNLSRFTHYEYLGIDLVGEFIDKANELYGSEHVRFQRGGFLESTFHQSFDYVIASGICNFKFHDIDNYEYIEAVIRKAFNLCKDGIAMDFLSDKVEYTLPETFHSRPERILSIAYSCSRNILLRNDYMPFEFSCFIFKDETFLKEDTLFCTYHGVPWSKE